MPIAGCCRWGCNLAEEATVSDLEIGTANQQRGSVYTLRSINNDRCGISRLSKIAHMRSCVAAGSELRNLLGNDGASPGAGVTGKAGLSWSMGVGQFEFPPTVEAHPVCAMLDGEHA